MLVIANKVGARKPPGPKDIKPVSVRGEDKNEYDHMTIMAIEIILQ